MKEYVFAKNENMTEIQKYDKYRNGINLLIDFLSHIQILQGVKLCRIKDDVKDYDLSPFYELDSEAINDLIFKYYEIDKAELQKERDGMLRMLLEIETEERKFNKL